MLLELAASSESRSSDGIVAEVGNARRGHTSPRTSISSLPLRNLVGLTDPQPPDEVVAGRARACATATS